MSKETKDAKDIRDVRDLIVKQLETVFSDKESKIIEKLLWDKSENDIREYRLIAFNKIGEFIENPKFIDILKDEIKKDIFGWNSIIYEEERRELNRTVEEMVKDNKVEEGEYPCRNRNCQSKRCRMWTEQRRSADESATTIVECSVCGTRFKHSD